MWVTTRIHRKYRGSPRNRRGSPPSCTITVFRMPPSADKNIMTSPATTTVEKKCGTYAMVCTVRLNPLWSTSFKRKRQDDRDGKPEDDQHDADQYRISKELPEIVRLEEPLEPLDADKGHRKDVLNAGKRRYILECYDDAEHRDVSKYQKEQHARAGYGVEREALLERSAELGGVN